MRNRYMCRIVGRIALSLVIAMMVAVIIIPANGCAVELYLEHRLPAPSKEVTAIAFSSGSGGAASGEAAHGNSGLMIAYGTRDGEVFVLDMKAADGGSGSSVFDSGGKEITAIEFSSDGRYLAVAVKKKAVWVLILGDSEDRLELKDAKGRIDVLAFSEDGRYLAAGGDRKDIFVWEVPSGQSRSTLKGHDDDVLAVAFHGEEKRIISAGRDNMMIVWDAASMSVLRKYELEARTMNGSGIDVTAAEVSADRNFLAVAINEHMLKKGGREMIFKYHLAFFDISRGVLLKMLEENNRKIEEFALYPGNCFVAFDNSTLQTRTLAFRNIESGSVDLSYSVNTKFRLLEFSPDGRYLAGATSPAGGEKNASLNLWSVDYDMPASGCFSGRVRLTSDSEPLLKSAAPRIAAVVPFSVSGTDEDLGQAAGHFLESALAGISYLRLVERSRVDEILKELKLQKSGYIDRGSAVEAGRLLGAGLIITGNIDRVGADLVVSTRIIDVETGEILGTRQVHCAQCGADDIFDAIDVLAGALVER